MTVSTNASNVAGYGVNLTFDSDVVEVASVESADLSGSFTDNIQNDAGWVKVAESQANGVDSPDLFTITFNVTGQIGDSSDLAFVESDSSINDESSNIAATWNDGSIEVAGPKPAISVGDATGAPGENVTVGVSTNGSGVAGYQANISFDPSVVEVESVAGVDFSDPTNSWDNDAGWVFLTQSQQNGEDSPTFANITFNVTGAAGDSTDLTFEDDSKITDESGDEIASTTSAGTVTVESATDTASVTFNDQSTGGASVNVASADLPEGGYVVIHADDNGSSGAVLGHSAYLGNGTTSDVTVALDDPITENQTLWAMAHTDDGDQTYEFPDADGAYTKDGSAVVDSASVTVTSSDGGSGDGTSELTITANTQSVLCGNAVTLSVIDSASGDGISNADVTIDPAGKTRQTDSNGKLDWIINDDDGSYTFTASKSGYQNDSVTVAAAGTCEAEEEPKLDINANQSTVSVGDTVQLKVLNDETGATVSGATVEIAPGGETKTTDANGLVTWTFSAANEYTFTASKDGFKNAHTSVTVESGSSSDATKLDINANDSTIEPGETVQLKVLNDETDSTVSGATVTMSPGGETKTTDSNGLVTWTLSESGTYTFTASKDGFTNAFTSVEVGTVDNGPFTGAIGGSDAAPEDHDGDGLFEDVEGDGDNDFSDAIALAFATIDDLTPAQEAAVDFNGDGEFTFDDAIELAFL